MIAFKLSATTHAPVEKVFSVVADPKRIPQWRTDVPGIGQVSGETKAGTTFVEEVHFLGANQLLMKVMEYRPNEKLVFQAQSGMPVLPTQTFHFSPDGNGTTIDLSVVMKTSGFLTMMELMLPALKKVWKKYFINLDTVVDK